VSTNTYKSVVATDEDGNQVTMTFANPKEVFGNDKSPYNFLSDDPPPVNFTVGDEYRADILKEHYEGYNADADLDA
jgi:hypothetical protein